MIRLVLSDIDGTLLPFGQWYIDDDTKAAIAELEEAGITFGPATGRPVADVTKAFQNDEYVSTCVASDGMIVMSNGAVITEKRLPNDQLQRIATAMKTIDWAILGVCYNEQDDPVKPITWASVCITEKGREILRPHIKYEPSVPNLDAAPDHAVYVAGMFGPMDDSAEEAIAKLIDRTTDGLHILRTAPGYYDVCLDSWNKADGAKALLDHLGISLDEVAFFGDSMNDMSLFELFDNTFCVDDGAPKAKEAARWVIPGPKAGGAVMVMRALARNKGNLEAALAEIGL